MGVGGLFLHYQTNATPIAILVDAPIASMRRRWKPGSADRLEDWPRGCASVGPPINEAPSRRRGDVIGVENARPLLRAGRPPGLRLPLERYVARMMWGSTQLRRFSSPSGFIDIPILSVCPHYWPPVLTVLPFYAISYLSFPAP